MQRIPPHLSLVAKNNNKNTFPEGWPLLLNKVSVSSIKIFGKLRWHIYIKAERLQKIRNEYQLFWKHNFHWEYQIYDNKSSHITKNVQRWPVAENWKLETVGKCFHLCKLWAFFRYLSSKLPSEENFHLIKGNLFQQWMFP